MSNAADAIGSATDASQPRFAVAQAPSFCRLCNVEFASGQQTWRLHVKSDGHVYKLQSKVADQEPQSDRHAIPPGLPGSLESLADQDDDDHDESELEEDIPSPADFVPGESPGQCLFCAQESDALDQNITHMAASHHFTIPFQDCLAVDLETVVGYLHFVIYGYRECISCGKRRSTVEGVQQHMVAKGHCRFDISPDTEEFYEIPQLENSAIEQMQDDGSTSVRLPSGRLVSHRKHVEPREPRAARRPTLENGPGANILDPETPTPQFKRPQAPGSSSPGLTCPGLEVAQRHADGGSGEIVRSSQAVLAAQLSRLRIAGDRIQQKEETRKRGRLERATNSIMTKRFRADAGDGRFDPRY